MMKKRYYIYIPKNMMKINVDSTLLELRTEIELLQDRLNSKIKEKNTLLDDEIYELSVELDVLIDKYMDQKIKRT